MKATSYNIFAPMMNLSPTKCAWVDDVPSRLSEAHFTEKFVGIAAKILGSCKTVFELMEAAETPGNADSLWVPFHNEAEWELVCFLVKNIGHIRMDKFSKLDIVDVEGDIIAEDGTLKHKQLELWWHDPVECMQELMGNPAFWEVMLYVPKHAYTDAKGENCIYDEMWTGDWWWNVQATYLFPSSSASKRKLSHWWATTSSTMQCLYPSILSWMLVVKGGK
ncbi:hypothetical protein EDD16DRAFT_1524576 [Pisolithus croceorrhizus]|nr:hypothetical protein EV401DRAFT_1893391 [Pisolithus croceorrhizus]KAI6104820.1 hypothetical protein EDD16DRAFT_1524576 [Pisolithus croceorrhizus]